MPDYLLDSNFFINAHRFYYPFDVVPSFWARVQDLANRRVIGSIDKVAQEIRHGNDVLKQWIGTSVPKGFFADSSVFIHEYAQIAQWANSKSSHYNAGALNEFLQADEADAWLVAGALHHGITVVTNEVSNPQMKARIAIPEPCNHFGVSFCNTIEMFRNLGVNLLIIMYGWKSSKRSKTYNYIFSPGRYIDTEAEEDDGISFEEKMKKLTEELMEQFEEGQRLEKEIKENLKGLG